MASDLAMPAVFISHSSFNREMASAVKAELIAHGISCWMAPDDVSLGQTWEDAVVDALSTASVFLLLWSKWSQDSSQVKRELSLAASQQKLIIPLRLDKEELEGTFAYYLTNTHWRELDSSNIAQCCLSIKEQILSSWDSLSNKLQIGPIKTYGAEEQKDRLRLVSQRTGISDLDVTHPMFISSQQARQGHTRILKIGIEEAAESLEVRVPAGIKSGTRLRIKGKGDQCANSGLRGDLYLLVRIIDS